MRIKDTYGVCKYVIKTALELGFMGIWAYDTYLAYAAFVRKTSSSPNEGEVREKGWMGMVIKGNEAGRILCSMSKLYTTNVAENIATPRACKVRPRRTIERGILRSSLK
jgi:hypothetical protein